jgi:hypothetical protein
MAALNRSSATLRIFGDSLNPDEISRILGCAPTKAQLKGQTRYKSTVYKTGGWLLKATAHEPADLDSQIAELFGRVTKDTAVWAGLCQKYEIDLCCGLFMERTDEAIELSTDNMKVLAERGIKLEICIYAPTPDIRLDGPCPCDSGKIYAECCAAQPKV